MITYADCVRMVLVDTSIPHSIVDIIVKYNEIIYGYLKGIIALFMLVYIFQVVVGPAAILNSTCNNLNMVAAYAFPSIFYDQHVLFPPFSIIYMKA